MSSSRGTSNSNKTAHVMNLLRKNTPQTPTNAETTEPPAAAPAPQTPPIITALHADAEVSSQIKDALSAALAEEEKLAAPQASIQPESAAVTEKNLPESPQPAFELGAEAAPMSASATEVTLPHEEPEVLSSPASAQESVPDPVQPIPALSDPEPPQSKMTDQTSESPRPVPIAENGNDSNSDDSNSDDGSSGANTDDSVLINVMQKLADEKADKYIRLFGLCSCERCRKDVIALALNVLPAKYVVMPEWEFNIRFDMYANRYSSALTAELLRACKEVMDNPRH